MSSRLLHHNPVRGLQVRLRAEWAREELDRRLADGADPGADPLLSARAECLITPDSRARLAAGLERVVATVDQPPVPTSSPMAARVEPCAARAMS